MIPQALLALMTRDAARSGPVMAIPCLAEGHVLCPHTGVFSHSHRGPAPSALQLPQAGPPGDPGAFGKGLGDLQVAVRRAAGGHPGVCSGSAVPITSAGPVLILPACRRFRGAG